jgi:hypothetical protein
MLHVDWLVVATTTLRRKAVVTEAEFNSTFGVLPIILDLAWFYIPEEQRPTPRNTLFLFFFLKNNLPYQTAATIFQVSSTTFSDAVWNTITLFEEHLPPVCNLFSLSLFSHLTTALFFAQVGLGGSPS